MANECKYYKLQKQYRYVEETTWHDVTPAEYQKGELYEYQSEDCGYIPPTPQYRTLTSARTCVGYDKYVLEEYQVSYDSGVTWTTTATSATTLVEADSPDCGYPPTPVEPIYRWTNIPISEDYICDDCPEVQYRWVASTGYVCSGTNKMTREIEEISYDSGTTWTPTGDERAALPIIEAASTDCGYIPPTPPAGTKWIITYLDGTTSSGECNSLTTLVYDEIPPGDVKTVALGNCVTEIGLYVFRACYTLTGVTMEGTVRSIDDEAFSSCINLSNIDMTNFTRIDMDAFYGCRSLTSLSLPSVTYIGDGAFKSCSGLTSVTLGRGVSTIGGEAFKYCTNLTSITINATTPPYITNDYAFHHTNDCPIYVPAASVNAYKTANYWSTYASRIRAIS